MAEGVFHTVLEFLEEGNFRLTHHAHIRMDERRITTEDIKECARTVIRIRRQEEHKFRVDGLDLNNEELSVVCALKDGLLIVTIY